MKRSSSTLFFLGVASCCLTSSVALAQDPGNKLFKESVKSTVFILSTITKEDGSPDIAMGSGVLIDAGNRYVLTNYHQVKDVAQVFVLFPAYDAKGDLIDDQAAYVAIAEKAGLRAKILHKKMDCDLALLQLDKVPSNSKPFRLAKNSPAAGQNLHSIYNPFQPNQKEHGLLWKYSPDKFIGIGLRKNDTLLFNASVIVAQSTNINDSGGPCYNDKGELVGVKENGLLPPDAKETSFFIDVSEIKKFLEENKITLTPSKEVVVDEENSATKKAEKPEVQPKKVEKVEAEPKKMAPVAIEPKGVAKTEVKPKKVETAENTPDKVEKADPPKKVAEKPKKTDTATKKKPPTGPTEMTEEQKEKRAESELDLIRDLVDNPDKRDVAIERLEKLIKTYPGTDAAKDAEALLQKLK